MPLPSFDAPRFAMWLRKWKAAERLEWGTISKRSGLHSGTLQQLARGIPQKGARERGQTTMDPRITTIARLAHGLDLDFAYVASKGGLHAGAGDRWESFSNAERTLLQHVLREGIPPLGAESLSMQLLDQLDSTLTKEINP